MTIRHLAGLILLAPVCLPAIAVGVNAQTVDDVESNCCAEVYRVGWEVGQLRSIASYATADYEQAAARHMERLGAALQAANKTCCRFCEAWEAWPRIQDGIRAKAKELLDSPQSDAVETRQAFREWVESRPADLVQGLNRCDLEEGMPCKWLGLVDCARAYFRLGAQLGHAMHALRAAGGREEGVESLATAARLLASLRTGEGSPGPAVRKLRCDYLWDAETGVERSLAEAARQPDRHTDGELAGSAAEAHRRILDLMLHGRPDLGIAPCPIGADHGPEHADCERRMEAGP